jgi:predicted nucleic-acid-binding protein
LIALDTNILLRYIMQDDLLQSARATELIESLTASEPGFVPLICLTELYWVLDHTYKCSRIEILDTLETLITSNSLLLEDATQVSEALVIYASGSADFDDCLIAQCALAFGCDSIFTFDKTAAKSGVMQLLS